jgi:hypothetical protein
MSKWSDVAELLQKIMTAKEVIPVQNDLINLQQTMFALQTDQMKLLDENANLKAEISRLSESKKFVFAPGKDYLIDPVEPSRKLCPVCTPKNRVAIPILSNGYCSQCKGQYR